MDDMIYEEFKGTGNMELHLNRRLAERRLFPAFDVERSGTRREELLLDEEVLSKVWTIRSMIDRMGGGTDAIGPFLEYMAKTKNNKDFIEALGKEML